MSEKTANTAVEVEAEVKPSESTDAVASSATKEESQEIDFSSMSKEEVIEFAKKEHEAKKATVQHLREQSKKNRPNLETLEAIEETHAEEKPKVEVEDLEERIAKVAESIVEKKLQERSSNYTEGSTDWLLKQPWATPFLPETPGSDPLFAKLAVEAKRLTESRSIKSAEDYQEVLRLAAVNVTGRPDALIKEAPKESATLSYQRSMSISPSTSVSTQGSKKSPTKEEIEFAIACGHDPKEMYK